MSCPDPIDVHLRLGNNPPSTLGLITISLFVTRAFTCLSFHSLKTPIGFPVVHCGGFLDFGRFITGFSLNIRNGSNRLLCGSDTSLHGNLGDDGVQKERRKKKKKIAYSAVTHIRMHRLGRVRVFHHAIPMRKTRVCNREPTGLFFF